MIQRIITGAFFKRDLKIKSEYCKSQLVLHIDVAPELAVFKEKGNLQKSLAAQKIVSLRWGSG
jgi:hypothetical protein